MQEFQIQSNIPVLILTIALIVVTVLGFLEFKKLSNRIDSLVSNIDSLKGNDKENDKENDENDKNDKNDNLELSNIYSMEPDKIRENIEIQNSPEITKDKYEENYEEEIKTNENKVREYIENAEPPQWGTKSLIISQTIKADDFTISKEGKNDIEEINSDKDSDKDSESDSESESESEEEEEQEDGEEKKYSSDSSDDGSEYSDSEKKEMINISDMLDNTNGIIESAGQMDTVQMLLNGVEGEELEKELNVDLQTTENIDIDVNDSMSVNELKQICKEKGLSVSGNKGKLISRIKENK